MPTCPMCAETIAAGVATCVHCGHSLRGPAAPEPGGTPKGYDVLQDKVGLVPNVRWKDNVFQGVATLVGTLLGVAIGAVLGGGDGAVLGGLAGLVLGGIGSGFVLMIAGLLRK